VNEDSVRIISGEPTPLQLSAWRRLWAILLAPNEPIAAKPGPENSNAALGGTREAASSSERE
jgi:hypothetical protein